jgi:hypothetical protein
MTMNEDSAALARHHSVLASWIVRQFGRALMLGAVLGGVTVVVVFVLADGDPDASAGWLALAVGFVAFGVYLASGDAPMPPARPMPPPPTVPGHPAER